MPVADLFGFWGWFEVLVDLQRYVPTDDTISMELL